MNGCRKHHIQTVVDTNADRQSDFVIAVSRQLFTWGSDSHYEKASTLSVRPCMGTYEAQIGWKRFEHLHFIKSEPSTRPLHTWPLR